MNTFQLYLILRNGVTYGQFYHRALDTNDITVATSNICFGQVGIARDIFSTERPGHNVGSFPYGTENIRFLLNDYPQQVEYYSNEGGSNTDLGSWVYRLSAAQHRQVESKFDFCEHDTDNIKCTWRQAAIECIEEDCKKVQGGNGFFLTGGRRRRRSLSTEELQSRSDRFCEYRDDGEFVFPLDCRGYFICDGGKVSFASCPEGQHFHPKLRTCVVESQYSCLSRMPIQKDMRSTDISTISVSVDNPMQTIKTLSKLWTLNLRIKPKAITYTNDTSVFYAVYNAPFFLPTQYQTPSILMERGSTKLKVCGSFNYPSPSTCQTIPTPLPPNKFTRVQIQQIPNGADSKFIVKYNGVIQYVGTPTNLQVFKDVKVYPRDPSKPGAKVETKSYKFSQGVTQGQVIETVKNFPNVWTLKMTIRPISTTQGDTNILHATPYFDSHINGFLKIDLMNGTTKPRICVPSIRTDSASPHCFRFFRSLTLNQPITLEISRKRATSIGTDLTINVSGSQRFSVKFNDKNPPQYAQDVNMYLSDYWMPASNVVLEAYEFTYAAPN
uniref:Chitin-binding type-2 domain-containing protein n=2 Tax=Clytia hemisphaerica TaxID=252671 RepID=A0A7M5WVK5_9CNID